VIKQVDKLRALKRQDAQLCKNLLLPDAQTERAFGKFDRGIIAWRLLDDRLLWNGGRCHPTVNSTMGKPAPMYRKFNRQRSFAANVSCAAIAACLQLKSLPRNDANTKKLCLH
jgi:hypothetical protein